METSTAPRKPCTCGHETQPKILQNLLHNYQNSDSSTNNHNHRRSPHLSQPPRCHSSQGSIISMHSPYLPSNRQSPMSPSSEYNHLIQSYNRQRSCSAASLGSTGSSRRESYSPSRDSSSSHESYSRASPVSMGPSPSPSPPAHNGSKLFGLLKGTMSSPYSSLYKIVGSSNTTSSNSGSSSSSSTDSNRSRSQTPLQSPGSQFTRESPIPHHISRSPAPMYSPFRPHEQYSSPSLLGKRSYECTETPMDLSCKKSKIESYSEQTQHTPSDSYCTITEESSPSIASSTTSSILQSILCGKASKLHSLLTVDTNKSSSGVPENCRAPQESQTNCKSPEPIPERRDSIQSNYSGDQKVTLVRKMILPIRARISDWLVKVIQYARSQPEFASLPHNDKVTLILNAWSRIMLLFMAETNFQFAVTPVITGEDSNRSTPDSRSTPISRESDDQPTMQSVDTLQNFIKKCQNLNLDMKEYHFFKMAVLFHPGYYGLDNADFVENVNSYSRQSLQDHIKACRPNERLRYSTVLLSINTILSGINCKVIENLFCRHISKDTDMEVLLKEMLLNYDQ